MTIDYLAGLSATVETALREDIGTGDLTASLIDPARSATADVIVRDVAVIAGRPWVDEVIRQIDPTIVTTWHVEEGDQVAADSLLFTLTGPARSLLTAERTALNFLQTISATATQTRRYVELVKDFDVQLLDTRKTIPGLRLAQKYAVSVGGGMNHRIGLFDAFLIKENHIAAAGSIPAAIAAAREKNRDVRLEIEVENLKEFYIAIDAEPDWIMLDNFSIADMTAAVAANNTSIKLEASGGIEQDSDLVEIAATGVDYISLGALTKHTHAIDLSMRITKQGD